MKIILRIILFIVNIIILLYFLYIYINHNKEPGEIRCITKYECLLTTDCWFCYKRQTRHPKPSPHKYCSCHGINSNAWY